MLFIVLIAALLSSQPLEPGTPLTGEPAAYWRFGQSTDLRSFIQRLDEPLWQEAGARLLAANPGREVAVEALIEEERARYEITIEATSAIMAAMASQPGGSEAERIGVVELAGKNGKSPNALKLLSLPAEATTCLHSEVEVEICQVVTRLTEQIETDGNRGEVAFLKSFTASRVGASATIAMSVADGNPLRLINREKVEAAGLVWPEQGAAQ